MARRKIAPVVVEKVNNKEVLLLVDALSREKNVDKEIVFTALEMALAQATKKRFADDIDVRVEIDRTTGEHKAFRRWEVVEDNDHEEPSRQIAMTDVIEQNMGMELGDFKEEPMEVEAFGRIGAQAAKQVDFAENPRCRARANPERFS